MNEATSKKKLILNTLIYSLSGILLKCFSFFLIPLYTAFLTTEDYGVTSVSQSFVTTFSFIVSFSLFSAVLRFYVDYKDDELKLKRFYGSIVVFILASSLIMIFFTYIFRDIMLRCMFPGVHDYTFLYISVVTMMFACQQEVYINILKSQQNAKKTSILSICSFFTTVAFNILFVVVLKMGAKGSLIAVLINNIIYTVYFWIEFVKYKKIILCIDIKLLKDALKYSIPIIPHNLSTNIALFISKILIGGNASLASVGIYSVASQFGNIADTVQAYVDTAYGPWLYENLKSGEKGYKKNIHSMVKLIINILGLFFIGISLFAQEYILIFVHSSYADAWKYVPFIVMTFVIKTAYYFYVEILFYYKEASRRLFIATLSSSLINLVLSYLLIPKYDVYGSIIADIIAMVLRVAIVIYFSRKYDDVGLKIIDFVKNAIMVMSFVFIGLSLSYFVFGNKLSFINFVFKCVVIICYMGYVFISNKNQILPYVKKIKKRIIKKVET